jgi:formate hydrogenlyase subunit 3/multisubunit Na+/H+ antiporter MnhD subunit
MYFMLIVKNLFNFYVEFEITLYFMCFKVFGAKKQDSEELECK